MKKLALTILSFICVGVIESHAQNLSPKMEDLSAIEFKEAVAKSSKTVIIPIGVIEKHGPHMPLGTDVYTARSYALAAAEQEYVVVFPWYHFGQIYEAKHQPGTMAYSPKLLWMMLQETLDELHRNGFEKIILLNGHGGNNAFLQYFCQSQLAEDHGYSLYWYRTKVDDEAEKKAIALTMHDEIDEHAANSETSLVKYILPDLVHPELANTQNGKDLDRISKISDVYTGIWWYASFPNHYAGDGSKANAEAGKLLFDSAVKNLVDGIRRIKADKEVPQLQKQFFEQSQNPLNTPQ